MTDKARGELEGLRRNIEELMLYRGSSAEEGKLLALLAAALQAAYREGVEAMRERFAQDWTPGCIYSAETARTFAETCAELVLGEVKR